MRSLDQYRVMSLFYFSSTDSLSKSGVMLIMSINSAIVKTWLAWRWCCSTYFIQCNMCLFKVTCALQSQAKTVYINCENTVNSITCYITYLRKLQTNLHWFPSSEKPANCMTFSWVSTAGNREVMTFLLTTSPFNLQAILETVKTGHLLRDTLPLYILTLYF